MPWEAKPSANQKAPPTFNKTQANMEGIIQVKIINTLYLSDITWTLSGQGWDSCFKRVFKHVISLTLCDITWLKNSLMCLCAIYDSDVDPPPSPITECALFRVQ